MKNPFEKEDHTGLYIGIALGVAAGVGLGYLFLTDQGAQQRRIISRKWKDVLSDSAAELIEKNSIISKDVAKVATDAAIKD